MMYVDFKAGNKDYKLRLDTRNMVTLEKQLGHNPLMIFGKGDELPSITTMVHILYISLLKFNHGISLDDSFDIFDDYIADGHTATDFVSVILEIYKVSGLIKQETKEVEEKNA